MPTPNSRAYYHDIDLVKNKLLNARLHPLSTTDRIAFGLTLSGADKSITVYDTDLNKLYVWDGIKWVVVGDNLYVTDGTLSSNRTVTSGGYNLTFSGSNTASSAIARGVLMNHTLVASANNDALVGLDLAPTYTTGAYTGVYRYALRASGIWVNHSGYNGVTTQPQLWIGDSQSTIFSVQGSGGTTSLFMRGNNPLLYNWWFQILADYNVTFNTGGYVENYYWQFGGSNKMNLKSSGALLIGTTSASGYGQLLEVAGSARTTGKFTVGSSISGSAFLEASSTNQGFLPPRMTEAQRLAIRGIPTALYTLVGGSGYVDGTYTNKPLSGGLGYSLTANLVVSGGVVTSCVISTAGDGYAINDTLSTSASNLGGTGAGFSIKVETVSVSTGLLVYQTNNTEGLYVNTSSSWKRLLTELDANGYIPYIGATQNVDLGEYGISSGYFQTDLTPTQSGGVGRFIWNNQDGTVNLGLLGGNVSLYLGQQQYARVVNGTGGNVLRADYQVVKIIGAQGQRLQIGLARADNDFNSKDSIGLIAENINNNNEGFIISSGIIDEINTTGSLQGETWADGDTLYLSGTTYGQLTNVKPSAPTHTIIIGFVVYAHANHGKIFVKVDNGYELDEIHDVAPTPYINNGVLYRDTATNLWKSATIPTVLGYTPVPSTRTLTINGTSYDLSADRSWSISTLNGSGTTNYVSKWTNSTTLGNSLIYDNGSNVLIAKTSDNSFGKLQVQGGAYFTGNMYIETSANPTQFMLRGTNAEFYFDAAYGGGTARMFINRAGTGNQSTLMFTTAANVVKGSAWDSSGTPWSMGLTNQDVPTTFKFGYGDIYGAGNWVWSANTSRVLTFTNTPYVNSYYIYHQGNLIFETDYDYDIVGSRNSTNKIFTLTNNFVSGSTHVYVNGIRYTPGASYDYTESAVNQITFTNAPDLGDLITVDYIKA